MHSRKSVCLLLALASLSVASICLLALADEHAERNLPVQKLFDFERYWKLFGKSYATLSERIVRKKLFLARAFRVLISYVSFKHRKTDHYLAINDRSDWTPAEIKRSYMNSAKLIRRYPKHEGADADEQLAPIAGELEIAQTLADLARRADETPGAKEISRELSRLAEESKRRRRRDAPDGDRQLSLDDLVNAPDKFEALERSTDVDSNNPNYERPEIVSFGAQADRKQPLAEQTANYLSSLPGRDFLNSVVSGASKLFSVGQQTVAAPKSGPVIDSAKLQKAQALATKGEPVDNVLHVDHRQSGCFFQPRDQGECGSCYIFATIALYEYVHCKQTGNKVALSEQYIIDCGSFKGLDACEGGWSTQVGEFVFKYGLELRSRYPYRGRQDTCPYDRDTWPLRMGYLRVHNAAMVEIAASEIDHYLASTPVQVNFLLRDDFHEYGGGVDSADGCSDENLHAMLIVGSGTEDGKDYWLVRNSHSVNFGEKGYYRMAKNFACVLNDVGVVSIADLKEKPLVRENKLYDGSGVRRRLSEYQKKNKRRSRR